MSKRLRDDDDYVKFDGFQKAVKFSMESVLKRLTLDTLKECYPQVDSAALENIRRQIIDAWRAKAAAEFAKVYEERELQQRLDELDEVINDAKLRQKRGEPGIKPGKKTVHELNEAKVISLKEEAVERLKAKVDEIKLQNDKLAEELGGIRDQVGKNYEDTEVIFGELDQLGDEVLKDEEFEQLLVKTRAD